MHRRTMLAATGGALATALSGCLGTESNDGNAAARTGTPTVERRDGRKVVVSNTGEVQGEPDLALLEVGVEADGDTAAAVRDELATRADALREALLEFGLEEDAVTTSRFRIYERMDRRQMDEDGVRPDSDEADEYVYYVGTHSFEVEVAEIDDVGAVIDAAVDGGADQVDRVTFTLSDEKRADLREEALQAAIRASREEAESIAAEVDGSIVEATVVDASGGRVSPVHRDVSYAGDGAAATATEAAPTSVAPGDVTVTADVRIEYEME